MRNGFGAGNGDSERRAATARDERRYEQRRAEVVTEVRAGRMTLAQAEDRMNGK